MEKYQILILMKLIFKKKQLMKKTLILIAGIIILISCQKQIINPYNQENIKGDTTNISNLNIQIIDKITITNNNEINLSYQINSNENININEVGIIYGIKDALSVTSNDSIRILFNKNNFKYSNDLKLNVYYYDTTYNYTFFVKLADNSYIYSDKKKFRVDARTPKFKDVFITNIYLPVDTGYLITNKIITFNFENLDNLNVTEIGISNLLYETNIYNIVYNNYYYGVTSITNRDSNYYSYDSTYNSVSKYKGIYYYYWGSDFNYDSIINNSKIYGNGLKGIKSININKKYLLYYSSNNSVNTNCMVIIIMDILLILGILAQLDLDYIIK